MDTQNAAKLKQNVRKMTLFGNKKLHFLGHPITWAGPLICVYPCQFWPFFWILFSAPKSGQTKAGARARVCCSANVFFGISPLTRIGFSQNRAAAKTPRLKGIRFLKMGETHFGQFLGHFWAIFSPKKSYYSLGFSVVLRGLIFNFPRNRVRAAACR